MSNNISAQQLLDVIHEDFAAINEAVKFGSFKKDFQHSAFQLIIDLMNELLDCYDQLSDNFKCKVDTGKIQKLIQCQQLISTSKIQNFEQFENFYKEVA